MALAILNVSAVTQVLTEFYGIMNVYVIQVIRIILEYVKVYNIIYYFIKHLPVIQRVKLVQEHLTQTAIVVTTFNSEL